MTGSEKMKVTGRNLSCELALSPKFALTLRQIAACLFALALSGAAVPTVFAADIAD